MVSKKILGVAIAAAFSSQAFAVIDETGGTNGAGSGAVVYAKEAITSAQVTNGMVQVTAAGTELNTQVAVGFGVTATTHAFVRFDLTNAQFKTAVVATDLTAVTGTITNVTVAQGGAVGSSYVIFDVTSGGLSQTDKFQLALAGLQVSPTAAATISYAQYSTSPAAVAGSATSTTGALATDSYQAISVANALKTTITPANLTADVNAATPFTKFTGNTATGSLGTVQFDLTAGALSATGTAVTTLAQVLNAGAGQSTLSVTGDLTFTNTGATGSAAATAANLTFGASNSDTAATNVPSAKLSNLTGFTTATAYPVSLTAASAINAGSYSLTFTPVGIANAAYGPSTATGSLGSISRNGATVQVPYLTTNAGLNQKVVLVNRGSSDVTYSVSYTTEGTVTATAGTAAAGTLKAKSTTVLKATDLVTLTGGSRTAATVTVLAPNTTIDAATQTVVTDPASVSFGSSDTVALDVK